MAARRLLCALALAPTVTVSFMPRPGNALPSVRTRPQVLGSAGHHGGLATLLGRDEVDWIPGNVVGGSDAPLKRSRSPWEAYQHALETKPLVTKMWTSFVIGGLGDILSQLVGGAGSLAKIDRTRLLIFASMGGLYIGSVIHLWYGFLDRLVKKPEVKRRLPKRGGTVALQLLLDQTFGAAVVNSGFLITLWLMQAAVAGNLLPLSVTYRAVRKNLEREFWPMLKANWKLWPFANLLNFALVPIQFRVLFANVVSVFWNMYMSASANRSTHIWRGVGSGRPARAGPQVQQGRPYAAPVGMRRLSLATSSLVEHNSPAGVTAKPSVPTLTINTSISSASAPNSTSSAYSSSTKADSMSQLYPPPPAAGGPPATAAAHWKGSLRDQETQGLFGRLCNMLKWVTLLAGCMSVIANLLIMLVSARETTGADTVVRSYAMVFGVAVVLGELEWQPFLSYLGFMESWVLRGLWIVFVAALLESGSQPMEEGDRGMVERLRNFTAALLGVLGALYCFLGVLCFRVLKRRYIARLKRNKFMAQEAEQAHVQFEIERLLADTEEKLMHL